MQLVEAMRELGVCDSQQAMLLADAKMSHKKMIAMEQELVSLQEKHNALQEKHNELLAERAKDKADAQGICEALHNLMYEPYTSQRRGFEMHRILYGCG
jgi:Txe/YoeB family toxin of Txe-Axe toxin-antitoxin module